MSIKPIADQLQAIQLKYNALRGSSASFTATGSAPMQFTTPKPRPKISVETPSEKNDAIQSAMLEYILDTYGKNGKDILLFPRDEKLLTTYIEAYVEQLDVRDLKGDLHAILAMVREAGEIVARESNPKPQSARRGMSASLGG